jgi:hypothetical protein
MPKLAGKEKLEERRFHHGSTEDTEKKLQEKQKNRGTLCSPCLRGEFAFSHAKERRRREAISRRKDRTQSGQEESADPASIEWGVLLEHRV